MLCVLTLETGTWPMAPQMCNWKIRGSWVDVFHEKMVENDLSEDKSKIMMAMVEETQQSGKKTFCMLNKLSIIY